MGNIVANVGNLYDDTTKKLAGFMTLDGKEQRLTTRFTSLQCGSVAAPLSTLVSAGVDAVFPTGNNYVAIAIPAGISMPAGS